MNKSHDDITLHALQHDRRVRQTADSVNGREKEKGRGWGGEGGGGGAERTYFTSWCVTLVTVLRTADLS